MEGTIIWKTKGTLGLLLARLPDIEYLNLSKDFSTLYCLLIMGTGCLFCAKSFCVFQVRSGHLSEGNMARAQAEYITEEYHRKAIHSCRDSYELIT